MARLILIRHGESVANAEGRFTVGPFEPLTKRGREEAVAIARVVVKRFDPVALYASPFVRALETARQMGAIVGLEPRVIEELREQSFGELCGQPYATWANDPSAQGVGRWRHRPPGGETLEEVAQRAGPALERIAQEHLGQSIVVVSHGGTMAALRGWVTRDFESDPMGTRNAGGWVVERVREAWRVVEEIERT